MAQAIFIPPLTLEAFKPTVLNCFLFRQTDLISGCAVRERTTPLDFNQQRSAGEMKAVFPLHLHHEPEQQKLSGAACALRSYDFSRPLLL